MPRRTLAARAAALLVLLAASVPASAQVGASLSRVGSGARAAGMGDAFVAISDDGTAASWNPAGLAQLRQPEFSFVYQVSRHGVELAGMRSPDLRTAYSNQDFTWTNASPEFVSAAVPFSVARRPVTVQGSWHRLYQLSAALVGTAERVPLDPPGASAVISRSDRVTGNIDVFSAAAAVKLSSRAAVGASFNWFHGDWSERFALVEPPAGTVPSRFVSADFSTRLRGHAVAAGLLLTYPSWTAGFVFHWPTWSGYDFQTHKETTGQPPQAVDASGARFRWPRSVAAGASRRIGSHWTAAVALTHDQWTDTVIDHVPGVEGEISFFDNMPPALSTTRNTLSLNAGVEHLFLHDGAVVPLRLGFGYEPQGAMDPVTRDPVHYVMVSAGAGYNTNRFKVDAAVQLRWSTIQFSDTVTVDTVLAGGLARDATGLSNAREWRIKVSAIYRIPDTDKVRQVLKRIFG